MGDTMYNEIASTYDSMTQFSKKWKNQRGIWEKLIEKYKPKNVLDFGCGSGFHSILLSDIGLNVLGLDPAEKMIELAKINRQNYSPQSNVNFLLGGLDELSKVEEKYDWILCLGNTIPHFKSEKEIEDFYRLCYYKLNPNGMVMVQLLNYDHIFYNKKRMVGINSEDENMFIRFYDFKHNKVQFNIVHINKDTNSLISWNNTELYPWVKDHFEKILSKIGNYQEVTYSANFEGEAFVEEKSNNLVVVAKK